MVEVKRYLEYSIIENSSPVVEMTVIRADGKNPVYQMFRTGTSGAVGGVMGALYSFMDAAVKTVGITFDVADHILYGREKDIKDIIKNFGEKWPYKWPDFAGLSKFFADKTAEIIDIAAGQGELYHKWMEILHCTAGKEAPAELWGGTRG